MLQLPFPSTIWSFSVAYFCGVLASILSRWWNSKSKALRCSFWAGPTMYPLSTTWWSTSREKLKLVMLSGKLVMQWPRMITCTQTGAWTSYLQGVLGQIPRVQKTEMVQQWKCICPSIISACTLRLAMLLALRTIVGGMHILAPDCSSWTRISRGASLRNALCTLGRFDLQWVRNGSHMIAKCLDLKTGVETIVISISIYLLIW